MLRAHPADKVGSESVTVAVTIRLSNERRGPGNRVCKSERMNYTIARRVRFLFAAVSIICLLPAFGAADSGSIGPSRTLLFWIARDGGSKFSTGRGVYTSRISVLRQHQGFSRLFVSNLTSNVVVVAVWRGDDLDFSSIAGHPHQQFHGEEADRLGQFIIGSAGSAGIVTPDVDIQVPSGKYCITFDTDSGGLSQPAVGYTRQELKHGVETFFTIAYNELGEWKKSPPQLPPARARAEAPRLRRPRGREEAGRQ